MNYTLYSFPTRRSSDLNDHHLTISGGSQNARYALSLGMTDEDGLMMDSWFKRYMGRLSGDFQLFDWLSLNSHVAYNLRERTHDNDITRSATEVWAFLPIRYPNDHDIFGNFAGRWGSNADYGIGEQRSEEHTSELQSRGHLV